MTQQNLKTIQKFFNYHNNDLLGNILYGAIIVMRSCLDDFEEDIAKILYYTGINISVPIFMQTLERCYSDILENTTDGILITQLKHAPEAIQNHPIVWPYYALYWVWSTDLNFSEIKNIIPSKLTNIVLRHHLDHLVYKKMEESDSNQQRSQKFYQDVAQGVTRSVELLSGLYQKKLELDGPEREHLDNIYFNFDKKDWLFNFYDVISNDLIEGSSFLLQDDSSGRIYVNYESIAKEIGPWHFNTSRKTPVGKSRNQGVNTNLSKFVVRYFEEHIKMRKLIFKDSGSGGGGKRKPQLSQYTVTERFNNSLEKSIDVQVNADENEEILEQLSQERKRVRAFPDSTVGETDFVANLRQQHKRNRAFSAKITKRTLLLKTDYEVPSKTHLKAFLSFVFIQKMEDSFNKEDFFRSVFITSLLTGFDYDRIVSSIFLEKKNNMVKYDTGTNILEIAIDPKLFSQDKINAFLVSSKQNINYRLPILFDRLVRSQKSLIIALNDTEISELLSDKMEKEYAGYLSALQSKFGKKIKINVRQMWRILATYRRQYQLEDMSLLFCMGRYQTSDRPRLAYASTLKKSQVFSHLIEKMYVELELNTCVLNMLGLNAKADLFKPSLNDALKPVYAGSKRVLNISESKVFFMKMGSLSRFESDSVKSFNIFSIALRYALSLTLGTRTFSMSDSFENMGMHTIIISEKAETLIGGIRVIPVCEVADNLINRYKNKAKTFGLDITKTQLLIDGEITNYKKLQAIRLMKEYRIDEALIEFVNTVPTNTGRHVITKYAIEHNFNGFYLEALLGHYISGGEQQGIFSSLNMKDYIEKSRAMLNILAKTYGVDSL